MPCYVRDAANPVLSQQMLKMVSIFKRWRDRLRPRRSLWGETKPAKAGSKLGCTRHGGDFQAW